jgi:hypothetical protein
MIKKFPKRITNPLVTPIAAKLGGNILLYLIYKLPFIFLFSFVINDSIVSNFK